MIEGVREIARRAQGGEALRPQLRTAALRLAEALNVHHDREEEWLPALIGGARWVQADTESVNQRHFEEHKALHAALVEVSVDSNIRWVASHVIAVLDTIGRHLAQEEDTFLLRRGVLSDEEPPTKPTRPASRT